MIFPTVHLNGTSKQTLLDDIEGAYAALDLAIRALANAAPNGRDYYLQGPTAIYTASAEHGARLQKMLDVKKDLEALAENIVSQGGR
jgi:hypothetical protein